MSSSDRQTKRNALLRVIRVYEHELRNLAYEEAVVLDSTGREILRKRAEFGRPFELTFGAEELEMIRGSDGSIFTHNHPRCWQFERDDPRHKGQSFSLEDIQLACRAELSEIRAVGPEYRFTMRLSKGRFQQSDEEAVCRSYAFEASSVDRELVIEVLSGELMPADYSVEFLHTVWTRVARIMGWVYNRIEE